MSITTKKPFHVFLIFIVIVIAVASVPYVYGNVEEYVDNETTIGDEKTTFITMSENETKELTSFTNITILESSPSDKEIRVEVYDRLSDNYVRFWLEEDSEMKDIVFEDYTVELVRLFEFEDNDDDEYIRMRVVHYGDVDEFFLYDYLPMFVTLFMLVMVMLLMGVVYMGVDI